jgi:hypothetical protein
MRFLLHVTPTVQRFNELVRKGKVDAILKKILVELKPEASYFAEFRGERSWILVVDLKDASEMPKFAEPFFLEFDAQVEFHPTMLIGDLEKAKIPALAKKWR